MDENAFVLGQFAKEFDDLTKIIKEGVANFLIPVISFLKDNITSLIGVFGLLAAPIVSQIIPDFGKMATMFDNVASSSKNMGKQASKDLKLLNIFIHNAQKVFGIRFFSKFPINFFSFYSHRNPFLFCIFRIIILKYNFN